MRNNGVGVVLWCCLVASVTLASAAEFDWFDDFEEKARAVNEGGLVFLRQPPEAPVHYLHNRITILPDSLSTGWVRLSQCHEHLDAVPALQIVFHPERIRKLSVSAQRDVRKAWVEGPSVQLEEVGKRARVCISAETRALSSDGERRFRLRNGPFMRRFLDGYYPMRVRLDVRWPGQALRLISVSPQPQPQPGFRLQREDDNLSIETLFEGKLTTTLVFSRK